jgi:hypothetical protein
LHHDSSAVVVELFRRLKVEDGLTDVTEANQFLRDTYIAEFNAHFTVAAAQKGSAFVRVRRKDLDWIFSVQHQRTVNNDNTIQYANRIFFAGQFMKTHDSLAFREPRTAHKL